MNKKYIITLIICILFSLLIGVIGSIPMRFDYFVWYDSLNKAPLNPPKSVFPIAWTILYILMGISLSLIVSKRYIVILENKTSSENYISESSVKEKNKYFVPSIFLFFLQISLNLAWTYIFFGLQSPLLGLIEIIILDIVVIITAIVFRRTSKAASYFLIPYIVWILFATYLTAYVFMFN